MLKKFICVHGDGERRHESTENQKGKLIMGDGNQL